MLRPLGALEPFCSEYLIGIIYYIVVLVGQGLRFLRCGTGTMRSRKVSGKSE